MRNRHLLQNFSLNAVFCGGYSQTLSNTGLKTLPTQEETSGFAVFKIDVLTAFGYIVRRCQKPDQNHCSTRQKQGGFAVFIIDVLTAFGYRGFGMEIFEIDDCGKLDRDVVRGWWMMCIRFAYGNFSYKGK